MKGHIRERSPGKWAIILDRYNEKGERKRKWHSFVGTKRQAQEECARLVTLMTSGNYVEPTKQTVAEYLDEWLDFMKPSVAAKTHERYAEVCRKTIVPQIGDVILSKLKTDRIDSAFSTMLTSGRRGGHRRAFAPHGPSCPPHPDQGPLAGRDVGPAIEEPCARHHTAEGRAQEDAGL